MKIASNVVIAGTSMGTILLLARWITGNALLSSEQSLVKFGILFAIIINCVYGLALIAFSMFTRRMNKGDAQNLFFTRFKLIRGLGNKRFVSIICYVVQFELWIVQMIVLSVFYGIFFGPNNTYLTFITIGIVAIVCAWISLKGAQTISILYSILLFVTLTIIPIYYFILNGATEVYEGIRLYHPYLLYFKDSSYTPFYISLAVIAFSHILVDLPTWYTLSISERTKRAKILVTAGVIKILIGFSLTAILLIAIYQGPFQNLEILLLSYLYTEDSMALSYLFSTFCLVSIAAPLLLSIKSLQAFNRKQGGSKEDLSSSSSHKLIFFMSIVLLSVLFVPHIHLLDLIISFGLVYVAVMPLFVLILFTNFELPRQIYVFFIVFIIAGQIIYYTSNQILWAICVLLGLGVVAIYTVYVLHRKRS